MMKKKVWLVLLAMVLVSGLVMFGCGGSKDDDDDDDEQEFEAFSFEGPWTDVIKPWGSNAPTIDGNAISITASSSTGFSIAFADIGYTYNSSDILIFTYAIEVTTPEAVLTVKNAKSSSSWVDTAGGSDYGKGKGREYILGSATAERSNYEGPLVKGTWDGTTGTFEVLMKHLPGAHTIGFQHNVWADYMGDGVKIAENSEYTLKITKIENAGGTPFVCECDGDASKCECGDDCDCPVCETAANNAFDDAVGLKTGIGAQNKAAFDETTGIIDLTDVTGSKLFTIDIPSATAEDGIKNITITYVCQLVAGDAKITLKNGAWGDPPNLTGSGVNQYPTLDTTAVSTLVIPEKIYAAGTSTISFQVNGDTNAYKLKIISVTMN